MIGSTTNGTTPNTVIQCNSSVGIVMTNITNLIVTNITVRSCLGNEYNNATVLIKQCTNVQLRHVVIEESHNSYGIVGINILGDSHFSYIKVNAIIIIYNDNTVNMENHSLSIDHYHDNVINSDVKCKITFNLFQKFYRVNIHLLHSTFQGLTRATGRSKAINIRLGNGGIKQNFIVIKSCQFIKNYGTLIDIGVIHGYSSRDIVQFDNCYFLDNHLLYSQHCNGSIIHIERFGPSYVYITNCNFSHNNCHAIYKKRNGLPFTIQLIIANTTISSVKLSCSTLIKLSEVKFHLIGPVVFHNISTITSVINLEKSNITCSNYIKFILINVEVILLYQCYQPVLFVKENSKINVTCNNFLSFAGVTENRINLNPYSPCFLQYLNEKKLDCKFNNTSYSITFDNNNEKSEIHAYNNLPITHCRWLPQSAFNTTMPLEVNKKYVKFINSSGNVYNLLPQRVRKKTMCYCNTNTSYYANVDNVIHS